MTVIPAQSIVQLSIDTSFRTAKIKAQLKTLILHTFDNNRRLIDSKRVRMTVQQFHKKDNQSVLELPTQHESLRQNNKKEYEQLMSFYKSEEWQKVERAHLNSDRRYYEGRKAMSLSEHSKLVSSKKKYYGVHPFQRRVEKKLIKRIEDRFKDKLLCECMKTLTPKQYQVIILFLKDKNTDEIAKEVGTTPGNVNLRHLLKRTQQRAFYAR